jgi:hypothetical protein
MLVRSVPESDHVSGVRDMLHRKHPVSASACCMVKREPQQLNTIEFLFLCPNIFNRSTIVVNFNFPQEKLQASFERCENYPMAVFKLSAFILNPSE